MTGPGDPSRAPTTFRFGMRHLVIVGEMGAGKTSVGCLLASELGLAFHDSDATLEAEAGDTGAVIAERLGVSRLHDMELDIFLRACESPGRSVISPASSVVDHEAGRTALTRNTTIWLTASDEVLERRTGGDDHRRDLAGDERRLLRLRREPWLEEVSFLTFDTGTATVEEVVATILERLGSSDTPQNS